MARLMVLRLKTILVQIMKACRLLRAVMDYSVHFLSNIYEENMTSVVIHSNL